MRITLPALFLRLEGLAVSQGRASARSPTTSRTRTCGRSRSALPASWAAKPRYRFQIALIWAAHIGVDRVLGYGLKYPTAFRDTHLGPV